MKATETYSDWEEQKGKLKQKFIKLTDHDLMYLVGKKEEMIGRLQSKLGKTREELLKIIQNL